MTNTQLTPETEAWNAVWDKFEGASYDERTAVFYQSIEDGVMDGEMAFEMLNEMYEAAIQQDKRSEFDRMIITLSEKMPAVFTAESHFMLDWLITNAIANGRFQDIPQFAITLAQRADNNIDLTIATMDKLAYHNQLAILMQMNAVIFPLVKESKTVMDFTRDEIGLRASNYIIFNYLDSSPDPVADNPVLQTQLNQYTPIDPEGLVEYMANLNNKPLEQLTTTDFAFTPAPHGEAEQKEAQRIPHEIIHNISELSAQFLGYLRRVEDVAYTKGHLVNSVLAQYLLEQVTAAVAEWDESDNADPITAPLLPDRASVEALLGSYLTVFNANPHKAAAIFELLPAWIRFLAGLGLVTEGDVETAVSDLRGLDGTMQTLWTSYPSDPAPLQAAKAWTLGA